MPNPKHNIALKLIFKIMAKVIESPAGTMIGANAVGFGLGSVLQSYAIIKNDKIAQKDKGFLFYQEILNGLLQISTFIAVALALKKGAGNLVKNNIIKPFNADKKENFKLGFELVATLLGQIIAYNVITPLLRNPLAAYLDKKSKGAIDRNIENTRPAIIPASTLDIYQRESNQTTAYNPYQQFEKIINKSSITPSIQIYRPKPSTSLPI